MLQNMVIILFRVITIFFYFYVVIHVSNAATKCLQKYVSNKYLLVLFHIYIIALFYYFHAMIPFLSAFNEYTLFVVGPMIGVFSNYLARDFLRK